MSAGLALSDYFSRANLSFHCLGLDKNLTEAIALSRAATPGKVARPVLHTRALFRALAQFQRELWLCPLRRAGRPTSPSLARGGRVLCRRRSPDSASGPSSHIAGREESLSL